MNQKRSDNFDKFSNKKKGSAVKEEYRQEKKKAKVEMRAAGEAMRQRKKDKERGIPVEPLGNNKRIPPASKRKATAYVKKGEAPKYGELASPFLQNLSSLIKERQHPWIRRMKKEQLLLVR